MVLRQIQDLLGGIYDVDIALDVYDYLVTDRRHLPACVRETSTDEQLVVEQRADDVAVSLYLDREVLARLAAENPLEALHGGNLADYWTALEGVSHFLYSTWRLDRDAPVSLLELETQAEVDKYALTVFLLAGQTGGAFPAQVHARLFDRVEFDSRLEPDQYQRYRTAHRCAAHYCRRLERRYVSRGAARTEAMVRELRRFYRLGRTAKLHCAQG